jgi:hypothetical protein
MPLKYCDVHVYSKFDWLMRNTVYLLKYDENCLMFVTLYDVDWILAIRNTKLCSKYFACYAIRSDVKLWFSADLNGLFVSPMLFWVFCTLFAEIRDVILSNLQ